MQAALRLVLLLFLSPGHRASAKLVLIKRTVLPAHSLLQFSWKAGGLWCVHSPHGAGGLQREEEASAPTTLPLPGALQVWGVPGLKGRLEPLSSWSDGKIKCTELLKTKLKAHGGVAHSHVSVRQRPEAEDRCGGWRGLVSQGSLKVEQFKADLEGGEDIWWTEG